MQSRALIEGEDDVCTDAVLDLHRNFRGKTMHAAIDMGFKGDALIIDMGKAFLISSNHIIGSKGLGIHRQYFLKAHTKG